MKLAVTCTGQPGMPAIFWLDPYRPHDAELIRKIEQYLPEHDLEGPDIQHISQVRAMRYSLERIIRGMDTISVKCGYSPRRSTKPPERCWETTSRHRQRPANSTTAVVFYLALYCAQAVDSGGYYVPDVDKIKNVMRPSATFNAVLAAAAESQHW